MGGFWLFPRAGSGRDGTSTFSGVWTQGLTPAAPGLLGLQAWVDSELRVAHGFMDLLVLGTFHSDWTMLPAYLVLQLRVAMEGPQLA